MGLLVLAQREADDVDVVVLQRALERRAPAATDVEQGHARLEAQLAKRQVDLGDLCFLQCHVVSLEVRTAVRLCRVEEQAEEVVRQIVVSLNVFEVRLEVPFVADLVWQVSAFGVLMWLSSEVSRGLKNLGPHTLAQFTHSTWMSEP